MNRRENGKNYVGSDRSCTNSIGSVWPQWNTPTWSWSRSSIPRQSRVKPRDFSNSNVTSPDHLRLECAPYHNQIEAYRVLTYKELREQINDRFVATSADKRLHDSERLGRLLLKLPLLAELDKSVIEEIFFVGLIGRWSIDCVLIC